MPYPILTLPYPFSRRLPQLLNPQELENLQIAAGHEIGPFKPIVQSVETPAAYLDYENSKATLDLEDKKNHNITHRLHVCEAAFLKCDSLSFEKLNASRFKLSNFSHIYFKTKALNFWHCKISRNFLKLIASRIPIHEISELMAQSSNRLSDNITLPFIFNFFPNITHLRIHCNVKNGWLSDLLKLKVVNLTRLSLSHTSLDELFGFTPDELYRFIKMQKPCFVITFAYVCNPNVIKSEDVKKTVLTLLEPRFHTVAPDCSAKIQVFMGHGYFWNTVVKLNERCWLFDRCLNGISKILHNVRN